MSEWEWEVYRKIATQEMRPYVPGEDLSGISVSKEDTPEKGGMIARGADNRACWYVSKRFFEENYVLDDGFESCQCEGAKFVRHIRNHLLVGESVICKICKLSVMEIAKLSLDQAVSKPTEEV